LKFDFDTRATRRSLQETIAWCTSPQLTATPEELSDLKRRVELVDQAGELIRQAHAESQSPMNRLLRRDYTLTEKGKRGFDLMSEAMATSAGSYIGKLRSPALKPSLSFGDYENRNKCEQIVQSVITKRAALLAKLEYAEKNPDPSQGRLLILYPEETVSDGASEYSSCGFFDVNDVPPWDTWVAFSNAALLSWVPGLLIDVVQKGIDDNVVNCIQWFD